MYENGCRFVGCDDSAHRGFFCFFYGRFVNRPYGLHMIICFPFSIIHYSFFIGKKGIVPYELTIILERTCRGRCPHLPDELYENGCRFVWCNDSAHRVFFCFFYGRFVNRPYNPPQSDCGNTNGVVVGCDDPGAPLILRNFCGLSRSPAPTIPPRVFS